MGLQILLLLLLLRFDDCAALPIHLVIWLCDLLTSWLLQLAERRNL